MKIYDISMMIHEGMDVYKGRIEKKPKHDFISNMTEGSSNESKLEINLHTGTHIDAPYHMVKDGNTIDKLDIRNYYGECLVIDLTDVDESIGSEDLMDKNIKKNEFVLFKTKNSLNDNYGKEFVYLNKNGAEYLKEKKISGVGIDALGIERNQIGHPTHKILFENGIAILEGIKMKNINEGNYLLVALPLLIKGADGAPTRAILIKE